MEIKKNNATNNRPEGDRILDAPLVRMNFSERIYQLRQENAWLNGDRNAMTLLHSDQLRVVLIALKKNAEMIPHNIEGASFIQVQEGRIWVETIEKSVSVDAGEGLALAPAIPRSIFAEEDAVIILTLVGDQPSFF